MKMTKLANSDVKPVQGNPEPPVYSSVPMPDVQHLGSQADLKGNTCWYVLSILATVFFWWLPCGVVGLVHTMIAKHEGERGNYAGFRQRMSQAKCWTLWAFIIGVPTVIAAILWTIGMTVGFRKTYEMFCGTDEFMYYDDEGWPHSNGSWWWRSNGNMWYKGNGSMWWNENGSMWWNENGSMWWNGNDTVWNATRIY